jgi:hypothetical protein
MACPLDAGRLRPVTEIVLREFLGMNYCARRMPENCQRVSGEKKLR